MFVFTPCTQQAHGLVSLQKNTIKPFLLLISKINHSVYKKYAVHEYGLRYKLRTISLYYFYIDISKYIPRCVCYDNLVNRVPTEKKFVTVIWRTQYLPCSTFGLIYEDKF